MKNFIKIIGIAMCLLTIVAINLKVSSQENGDTYAFLLESQQALAQSSTNEGGQTTPPSGRTCGGDKCTVTYSIGVYTVSEEGTYYHCKRANSGTCNSSECDIKCDAL